MAKRRLNKRLLTVALMVVAISLIAIVVISQFYVQLYPTNKPQPTTTPTATPIATPNLSSAIPDNGQRISVNITALNTAHFAIQWDPIYFVHVTNNGNSPLTVVSIIATGNDQTNFVYWNGTQIVSPNTTEQFSSVNPYDGWVMNDIYVYYEISGQLFLYSLAHPPLPTYSPVPTP
jgi:hypothetical protein